MSSECDVDNFVLHLAKLGIYSTKLEETSDSGIDFLDMRIFKGPDFASTGVLLYRPVIRDKGRILHRETGHHASVLLSWPVAFCTRLYERSSAISYFEEAKGLFIGKFRKCGYDGDFTRDFDLRTRFITPQSDPLRRPFRRISGGDILWLVLPFHPVWAKSGVHGCLPRFQNSLDNKDLLQASFESVAIPTLRIAWRLPTLPFASRMVIW